MSKKSPSYIFKSKHGVYYFQLKANPVLRQRLNIRGRLYRQSLRTKDRQIALMLARRLWMEINYNRYAEYAMTTNKKMSSCSRLI